MNLNQLKVERNKDKLRRLAQKDGNKLCFDCGVRGPLYVVTDFYILVCSICSSTHRSFQHKVKGISMCTFADKEVTGVEVGGNDVAAQIWLAHFKGTKPRSGDVHAIQNFVESTFVKELYVDKAKKEEFKKSIQNELNPETKPHVSTAETTLVSPLSAQINAPAPQARSSVPVVAATQRPQPPQVDLFNGFSAAPAPVSTTPSASNPDNPSNAKPTTNLLQDLFSVPQATQPSQLVPQPSYMQPPQMQQHLAAAPYSGQGNAVGSFPSYPAQNLENFYTSSYNSDPVPVAQENRFQNQGRYSNFNANSTPNITPVGLQQQPQMTEIRAPQPPFSKMNSVDFFQPTETNLWGSNPPSASAVTTHQPARGIGAEIRSNDKIFASLDPFGMK
ncbi:unnamed protein product [Phytomonas sp. EM1]|nr:unnamed protein product [Phytomonas sp. EM1]|eukprot:CCW65639.1 unnamed protein product [Phytomonas sp. isolate EM1]